MLTRLNNIYKLNKTFSYNNSYTINGINNIYNTNSNIYQKRSYAFLKDKNLKESYIKLTQSEIIETTKKQKQKKEIDIEKIMTTNYIVDENSSKSEIDFEEQMKRLMVEQGTDDISAVKIPKELIEQVDFKKRFSPDVMRFADYFFSKQSNLVTMAIKSDDFPSMDLPQIAFIGRSNVGKSSLLNTLLNNQIAHVSKTPGCTKSVNFYSLWDKIMLVDLPGYGYSKVSKEKATVWGRSISEYLLTSHKLTKLFLLVDSRVGLQKNDIEVMKLLDEHRVGFQVVLTKIDKATTTGLKRIYKQLKEEIMDNVSCLPNVVQCSSKEKRGIQQIRSIILEVTNFDKDHFKQQRNTFQPPEAKLPPLPKQNFNINNTPTSPLPPSSNKQK